MTNYEQAQSTRNEGVCAFLEKYTEVYADDVAFSAIADKMLTDTATVNACASVATTDNTGYAIDKTIAKDAASVLAAQLCANSRVKLDLLGNLSLYNSLNGTKSFYFNVADALCTSRLLSVYDVMYKNQEVITTDYVTATQLATLLSNINTFSNRRASTSFVNGDATLLTKQFKKAMKATNVNTKTIKTLVAKYKTTNPLFHDGIMAACKLPTVTKLNTSVSIDVFDAESKGVLAKVAGTLTKSKDKPFSNVAGVMQYMNVLAGTATLSFSLKDYITKLLTINIKRGKMNKFNVSLTPGIMTAEEEAKIKAKLDSIIAEAKAKLTAKKKKRKDARTAAALRKK